MTAAALLLLCGFVLSPHASGAKPAPLPNREQTDGGRYAAANVAQREIGYLRERKVDLLEAETETVLESRQRLADGRWRVDLLYVGLYGYFDQPNRAIDLDIIQQWQRAYPTSKTAAVTQAVYWMRSAADVRGSPLGTKVQAKVAEEYQRRVRLAREVLESSRAYATANPVWYQVMIAVGIASGWPLRDVRAVFDEAVAREPAYYSYYLSYGERLTPRWGGSLDEFHKFVDEAVDRTRSTDGQTMYARLYGDIQDMYPDTDIFREMGASWRKMKAGFEDLVKRYPSRWNMNAFASYACKAGDKKTFLALLPKVESNLNHDAWASWRPFESCKEAFLRRT